MQRAPAGSAQMLCALDFYLEKPYEIALLGEPEELKEFYEQMHAHFLPNKVVMAATASTAVDLPLLADKVGDGGARVFVCRDSVCSRPLVKPEELALYLADQGVYGAH
jgi:uncharacterized protein YyaL (SSP411 family)